MGKLLGNTIFIKGSLKRPKHRSGCPKHTRKKTLAKKPRFLDFGRSERIRTFDPLHPMQVRYQTAPHSDKEAADYIIPVARWQGRNGFFPTSRSIPCAFRPHR